MQGNFTTVNLLGRVVRKPVNANPGLKVNRGNRVFHDVLKAPKVERFFCTLYLGFSEAGDCQNGDDENKYEY